MRTRRTARCVFRMVAALLLLQGCGHAPDGPGSRPSVHLADRLYGQEGSDAAQGTSGSFERHRQVTRGDVQMDAVTLIAPVMVRAGLDGFSGRFTLIFAAAPVFNLGDGMQLDVLLEGQGRREPVYSRYFDAGRNAADRKWTEVRILLDLAGAEVLEIRVSGGPQGDLVADWLALAGLRLEPK